MAYDDGTGSHPDESSTGARGTPVLKSRSWPRRFVLNPRDPRERLAAVILVVAVLVGATVAVISLLQRSSGHHAAIPPTPPSPAASGTHSQVAAPAPAIKPTTAPTAHCTYPEPPGGAAPFHICIPALHVDASMMQLGLNHDRTIEVPPLSRVGEAGWYKYSARPGAPGPTVILGHVDSAQYGEGVFFRLGQLHTRDKIIVSGGDGTIATFEVDKVSEIPKSSFPTDAVYGRTSGPAIRLVTCGGRYNSATGSYEDNIVVYGTLHSLKDR